MVLHGHFLFDYRLYIVYIFMKVAVGSWRPQMASIRVKALPQEVAKRIREMIRKGILKKGDRILETPLCESMGVSRTPLREGLRLLSSEGLIELIPNRGARVIEPSMRDVREMFFVMSILEGTCARECAKNIDEKGMEKLESLYGNLENTFRNEITKSTWPLTKATTLWLRSWPEIES
jgi:DNA-binding GntR family transcriptional regulator